MRDTILIVEDDEMVRQGIVDALQLRNWKTDVAATCEEAEKKIKEDTYMLYILDMKLPDGNGITLCRKIRSVTENPVLFLSAYDNESYIVEGLEAGGDDYVVKPFRTLELLARIKSLLKHSNQVQEQRRPEGIRSGHIFLDLNSHTVYVNDRAADLTLTEYRILYSLINNAPGLVTRGKLLDLIWENNDHDVDDNALSVYMNRIRSKLTVDSEPVPIETRRGTWISDGQTEPRLCMDHFSKKDMLKITGKWLVIFGTIMIIFCAYQYRLGSMYTSRMISLVGSLEHQTDVETAIFW